MAVITYNDLIRFQNVYRTTAGGTVFSANYANTLVFDYFADNAVVNDAFYVGFNSPRIKYGDLSFTIGTPLVATTITVVWEYSTGSSTWATLTCTDNTNAFQNSGVQTVTFAPPTNWTFGTKNGVTAMFIRCRITAVTGITEGGANATTVAQCKSLAVTISDPGNTVNEFCELAHQADLLAGWGVVTKLGTYAYYFASHIFLGYENDASVTTIADTKKNIQIEGTMWSKKGSGGGIISGTLVDDTARSSKDGCTWTFLRLLEKHFGQGSGGEKWELYSSLITDGAPYGLYKAYNSICNAAIFQSPTPPIYNNVNFQNSRPDFGSNTLSSLAYVNKFQVSGSLFAFQAEWNAFLRGLVNVGCGYIGDANLNATSNFDSVLVDPTSDTYQMYYYNTPTTRGEKLFRNYTVNLKVISEDGNPIEGVNISIKDGSGVDAAWKHQGYFTSGTMYYSETATGMGVDTDVWSIGDYVKLGGEICQIVSGTYPDFVVTRAQLGTEACKQQYRQTLKRYSVVATDASGLSGEIIVETNSYGWVSGNRPGVQYEVDNNPFTITISKAGYETYSAIRTITEAINETIKLKTAIKLRSGLEGDKYLALGAEAGSSAKIMKL